MKPAALTSPGSRNSKLAGCRAGITLFVRVAAVLTLPAASASAQQEPPEAAAASQPAFRQALELTEREAIALDAVRDRNEQLDETAFYMILDKAEEIARLERQDLRTIDRPSAANLVLHPARYRGWPVRVDVTILRVEQLRAPSQISPPPDWPADKVVWKMAGYIPSAGRGDDTPALVFSTIAPQALGEPSSVGPDGEKYYDDRRPLTVAGFFYKLYHAQDESGRGRDFPVLIAWSLARDEGESKIAQRGNLGIMILVALLIGYLFARRWARRGDAMEPAYHYRPLREDLAESGRQADDRQVAPELADAARRRDEQRKEHESAADADGES